MARRRGSRNEAPPSGGLLGIVIGVLGIAFPVLGGILSIVFRSPEVPKPELVAPSYQAPSLTMPVVPSAQESLNQAMAEARQIPHPEEPNGLAMNSGSPNLGLSQDTGNPQFSSPPESSFTNPGGNSTSPLPPPSNPSFTPNIAPGNVPQIPSSINSPTGSARSYAARSPIPAGWGKLPENQPVHKGDKLGAYWGSQWYNLTALQDSTSGPVFVTWDDWDNWDESITRDSLIIQKQLRPE